tara:strand:+ start:3814 stop:4458 length:645 start_codon:yes stop_codon:yes gene_type:complete
VHYRIQDGHPLPHNPFKAIVAPRPIGWISTVDKAGRVNLAPYSFFNGVADDPPMVMFSINDRKVGRRDETKDSLTNVRETGEFAANVVGWELRDAMNLSSGAFAPGEDEMAMAGLTAAPCLEIAAPRIAEAPATLECRLVQELALPHGDRSMENVMVIGQVVAVHIRDDVLTEGIFDLTKVQPVARCGYKDYAVVRELFAMTRPGGGDAGNLKP